jgi:hypothetical protein
LYYSTFEVQLVSGIDINGYCNVSFISIAKNLKKSEKKPLLCRGLCLYCINN